MKIIRYIAVIGMAALLLAGCRPSTIEVQPSGSIPEGAVMESTTLPKMTLPETTKYTIPADAETGEQGGPGAMQTSAADYSYFPEDKRPENQENDGSTLVIIYKVVNGVIDQDFDSVEVCDAASLIQSMINCGAIREGTEVLSFDVTGKSGLLVLNELNAAAPNADEKMVAASVVNTFIDNLDLEEVQLVVGGEDYGKLGYSTEYDKKK